MKTFWTGSTMVWTRNTLFDEAKTDQLLPFVPAGKSERYCKGGGFVELSEKSDMSLADVLSAARTLMRQRRVRCEVCRSGDIAKIWRRVE